MLTLDPQYLPIQKGHSVLDLGCGEGRHITGLMELKRELTLVGLDINLQDLHSAKNKIQTWYKQESKNTTLLQGSGLRLPFADCSFDHVVCSEVLEHVEDYRQILTEIKRVLKKDGHLCISVPRAWPEKVCWLLSDEYHQVEGGHLRIFNAKKLKQEVSALGMYFYKGHWAHALHAPYWWLKCLFWNKDNAMVRSYHKLLVWDLMKKPRLTCWLEKCLNPLCGKSVVMYFRN